MNFILFAAVILGFIALVVVVYNTSRTAQLLEEIRNEMRAGRSETRS